MQKITTKNFTVKKKYISTSLCTKYHQCCFCFTFALQLAPHEPLYAERRSIIFFGLFFCFWPGKNVIATCRPFMIVQGCLDQNPESLAGSLPTKPPVPSAQPPIPLLSHLSLRSATHSSSYPLIPQLATHPSAQPSTSLLSHPSLFLATHPSALPPIPLLSHSSLCLATHPSKRRTIRKIL